MLDGYRGSLVKGFWPTIPEMFRLSCHLHGDRPCFTEFSPEYSRYSYREAEGHIERVAAYLRSRGVEYGDRVVITGKNSPAWAFAYLAVLGIGAVVVPIDYQLSDERIAHLARFAGLKGAFIDTERFASLTELLGDHIAFSVSLSTQESPNIMEVASDGERGALSQSPPEEHDTAAILFTSGTTGNEKGVVLTHANLSSDVYQACDPGVMTASREDVWYALLPLHHSYTMTAVFLEAIKHGSELIFARRMVTREMLRDMREGGVSILMGIPLLFNKLLKGMMREVRRRGLAVHLLVGLLMRINGVTKRFLRINLGPLFFRSLLEKSGLRNIRLLICGGGPLAPETFRRYNELGLNFVQGYGLTETGPILTLNPIHKFKLASVGRVFPLVDMRILNPDEEGNGEIAVKGPNVSSGYYKDPQSTAELFTSDGYLRTGDVGYLDREHYLYLTGRKKSLIITEGGKNVYPEEIEDQFQLYQEIEQIMVTGYLHDRATRAEGIEALVYPNRELLEELGREPVEERIKAAIAEVNARLLPYKRIDKLSLLDEPMATTTTQKIKRAEVLQRLGRS
jgi:long-chain acyl-CoA synthetase